MAYLPRKGPVTLSLLLLPDQVSWACMPADLSLLVCFSSFSASSSGPEGGHRLRHVNRRPRSPYPPSQCLPTESH
ncbi:hypothetical protein B0T25DRAFT_540940 [Lasiosphaeria hispida]|uniref:Secreted protein n=1 Tax=Lasiosphaeria hispida TaxID=260671 RepID=A0AAJ0HNF1_9PEZI|nr:hypothetical protein B0T25DRAFT_540940 [Lasiosphaeria hispida]